MKLNKTSHKNRCWFEVLSHYYQVVTNHYAVTEMLT